MVWIKVSWSGRRQPQNGANRSLNLWNMESHGKISNWRIGEVYVYTTNYYTLQATTAASTGDFKSFLAYKLIKYIYY